MKVEQPLILIFFILRGTIVSDWTSSALYILVNQSINRQFLIFSPGTRDNSKNGCTEVADDQQRKTDYMEITIDLSTCRNFQDNDKVLGGSCSFFSNVFVSSAGINAVKVKVIS